MRIEFKSAITVLAIFFLVAFFSYAQNAGKKDSPSSAGISEVTAVEGKKARINTLRETIEKYKEELMLLEQGYKEKLQKLKDELAALYKERDDKILDLKAGFFCSECKRSKTELEKQGINFQKHLGDVKGTPIPASTEQLEAVREEYKTKIAYKKVQIQNFEKGDPQVLKKKNDIAKAEAEISKLCQEITAHSKDYEKKIEAEAKSKHTAWVSDLMRYASNLLIQQDKTTIQKAKITAYQKEFEIKSAELRAEIKKQTEQQQEKKKNKVWSNGQELQRLAVVYKEYINPLEAKLAEIKTKIRSVEAELRKPSLSPDERKSLTAERDQLNEQAVSITNNIRDYKTSHNLKVTAIQNENMKLEAEIWELTTNLSKTQNEAVAKLKIDFDKKIANANQAITNATLALGQAKQAYQEKEDSYNENNNDYYKVVGDESNRMLIAGQSVSCPVSNQARTIVGTSWNQMLPCVSMATTLAKPYSTDVFGSYCPKPSSSSYLSDYKNFLINLTDEERKSIRENSNVNWFDSLFKEDK